METVRKLIESNILDSDGKRITKLGIKRLLQNPDLLQRVVEQTCFLQYDAPIKVRLQCILQGINEQPLCHSCGTIVKMRTDGRYANTFPTFCSTKCISTDNDTKNKRRRTNTQRYGHNNVLQSTHIKEQASQKHLNHYGVDNPLKSPQVRRQISQTNFERYGVEQIGQSKQIQDKARQTRLNKYGVDNVMKDQFFQEQASQTNLERYGVTNPFHDQDKIRQSFYNKYGKFYPLQVDDIKQKMHQTMRQRYGDKHSHTSKVYQSIERLKDRQWLEHVYVEQRWSTQQIAKFLSIADSTVLKYLHEHQIEVNKASQGEEQFALFLQECGVRTVRNTRHLIPPKEIDVYLPEYNLAFEYDGVFWHSELNGKDKFYHRNKTDQCSDIDVRLLHVFDNEWLFQTQIVKSRLRSLLGLNQTIAARNCQIAMVDTVTANEFFHQTHLQDGCNSSINYALFHNNVLVAMMSFGRSRYTTKYQYELLRFSTQLNANVVGGAAKLFKAFKHDYQPTSVVSYCDLRWNTGSVYERLGFIFSHRSYPNYRYFKPQYSEVLYSRVNFQKHKLKDKLETFDPNKTEWQNMVDNGYDRIWDCGNDVYVWTYED